MACYSYVNQWLSLCLETLTHSFVHFIHRGSFSKTGAVQHASGVDVPSAVPCFSGPSFHQHHRSLHTWQDSRFCSLQRLHLSNYLCHSFSEDDGSCTNSPDQLQQQASKSAGAHAGHGQRIWDKTSHSEQQMHHTPPASANAAATR